MFIALDDTGKRVSIENAIPGNEYHCPICNSSVIIKAKDSKNIRTHFAHKSLCDCDDWKHDMSEWHYQWQLKFPEEWREVVVEANGIKHRTDVMIEELNTVIEFQHSYISPKDFSARNTFYNACGYIVVWVFDANSKLKQDGENCFVWNRPRECFDEYEWKKSPYCLFVQNYSNNDDNILFACAFNRKSFIPYKTDIPIKPENFLKQFKAINDANIPSIDNLNLKAPEKSQLMRWQQKYDLY